MANYSSGRGKGEVKLRDFAHAARTFTSDAGYTLAPKVGFGFHVRLIYNQPGDFFAGGLTNTLSVLVKSAELPKFNIETEVLNKYNKKEVFQKKITYEPINIIFHDDGANTVRDMWLAYNQYYFADSNLPQQAYDLDDTYSPVRLATRYGLDTGRIGRFLSQVEIYSMANHVYTKYTLLNPLISSFDLDTHDYSEGGKMMQATMRLEYENVLYAEGATEAIPGFGLSSFFYDNEFSELKETNLSYPNANRIVDETETQLYKQDKKVPMSNFDVNPAPKIDITKTQQVKVKAEAVNSLQGNRRFSFPTATMVDNQSQLVDINANNRIKQGVVNRSGAVTSNGVQISNGATSSLGSSDASNQMPNAIYIQPKVPAGLNAAETETFNQSYPPLPSTDSRTRSAPYA
jgi:hypothetical protein